MRHPAAPVAWLGLAALLLGTGARPDTGGSRFRGPDRAAVFRLSSQSANQLNQMRANLTYFHRRTHGINFGWQNTWAQHLGHT